MIIKQGKASIDTSAEDLKNLMRFNGLKIISVSTNKKRYQLEIIAERDGKQYKIYTNYLEMFEGEKRICEISPISDFPRLFSGSYVTNNQINPLGSANAIP